MDNALKAIMIGVGVVITLAVISIGFLILRQGQDTSKNALNKIDNMNTSLAESDYTLYDGLEVSGSEVLNTIRKFKSEYIAIQVKTGRDASGTWYIYNATESNGTAQVEGEIDFDLSDALDPATNQYINPNGRFLGSVLRDTNGSVSAIVFEQK